MTVVIHSSDITTESAFLKRRQLIQSALLLGILPAVQSVSAEVEAPNTIEQISRYNNYYEFSTNKEVIWKLAEAFKPHPWTLTIEGEVQRPRTIAFDDLLKQFPQEERIYRLRCVEGWAMVIPWQGFSLASLIKTCNPTSRAKFVEFIGLERPTEMIGQRNKMMAWPYTEGLRIDEALHPLTLLVTGLYGHPLPNQNGAPLRLAVPWKYGFKSIKAITKIRLVEEQPVSSWMRSAPSEYGFYANVNPDVSHPRWSQRREVRIGHASKQPTLLFNGYADQVASMYQGMDLVKYF
ncbi:protein-methionine-sulfoxide reductase catalytic subunit MsrP [Sapientia aquatica]|uniref:Protein-methionine-sulfoxide reductase catalytic subunit MsrP n=1 Tax=Sapientia aquatica TaxID=1549640 RepID=A0A4R5W4D6_9BURK|nr:protein-methionine-sulfoxide reductase catalytic subunit MsrP [Sapientia aquatica]TDK66449.1 protein-methionine-sulfoxide reductase catalytic subunit MsrP [Sapientia aquatica]